MSRLPAGGRFSEILPISAEAAFRLVAVRDTQRGVDCVLACPLPKADPAAARAALARAYWAHSVILHPALAWASELGPEGDYVVFDCPARLDLAGLLTLARSPAPRVRHGEADGFVVSLRDALFAAAAHQDPRDGGPLCLGTIGHANVLFAPDGRFWLLGLGHNLPLADEHGHIGGRSTAFAAPEVAVGARPSKSSDFVGLLLFARSLVPFMVLERSLVRILAGNSLGEDLELARRLVWFDRSVVNSVPHSRASIEEAIATSDRIRALLGTRPDPDAFRARIGEILSAYPRLSLQPVALRVGDDGAFVERGGARVEIPGRGPLRRLARALAVARLETPGAGLTVEQLFEAGWPKERASARAAKNRVHVAINTLRKKAFDLDLELHAGTYRIAPSVWVELAPAAAYQETL